MQNIQFKFYLIIVALYSLLIISCYSNPTKITKGIEISASTQYHTGLAEFLIDNIDTTGWNSGKGGKNWLRYNFEKPVFIDSIRYTFDVDFNAKTIHQIYYKQKGSPDSFLIESKVYQGRQDNIAENLHKDNVYELVFVFEKEDTWIDIKYMEIYGRYKNWLQLW